MNKMLMAMLGVVTCLTVSTVSAQRLGDLPKDKLIFGVVPAEDPREMLAKQATMEEHLKKYTGLPVETFVATDYTAVVEAMRAGRVHVAFFGPFSYVMAAERANAIPLVVSVNKEGGMSYQSYLTTTPKMAADLGLKTGYDDALEGVEGLREFFNKLEPHKKKFTFTFTDPGSTSGFAVPRHAMHSIGVDPKGWFRTVGFVGGHDAGQLVVKNNIIDFAACWDGTYHRMRKDGRTSDENVVIIWKSSPIPESPIAARRDMDTELIEKIRKAFLEVPEVLAEQYGALFKGFAPTTEEEYRVIVEIKKMLDTL